MTPEEFGRAGDLFARLRELPEKERSAALDAACQHDPQLRARVAVLLDSEKHAESDSFLARPALAAQPSLTGTVVGRYRLTSRVGSGGMGVVYEAEDLRLNRRVAVKVLPLGIDANALERIPRFQREARAIAKLNHPHIVSIFDAAMDRGCCYIAMELVEGRTLRAYMSEEGPNLDVKTVLDVLSQTASALSAAHQAGIDY